MFCGFELYSRWVDMVKHLSGFEFPGFGICHQGSAKRLENFHCEISQFRLR